MKKYNAITAILIGIFILTSCGSELTPPKVKSEAESTEATITSESDIISVAETITQEESMIFVTVNDTTLTAKLEDNSSAEALLEKLSEGDLVIEMQDYGDFEKVGDLGFDLPRNDEQYTTKAGDIVLYQGNSLVFYYDTNSWNFTKLGEFQDVTQDDLKELFGGGEIEAKISLKES